MHFLVFIILWVWMVGSGGLLLALLYGLCIDVFKKKQYYTIPMYLILSVIPGAAFGWSVELFLKLVNA